MKNSFKFYSNKECDFFPCHKIDGIDEFNCLFCYCPLYLKEECIGNYKYTPDGVKDCSSCLLPHKAENYEIIIEEL